jgi:2-amino-4-hydroxy-6-hydroxymethyldihydropteridine diphosphokinase
MHRIILSLAANCNHERNLAEARIRLYGILFATDYTTELWTEPVGSNKARKYLNQLVFAMTELSIDELSNWLKQNELDMGRTEEDRKAGIVRIDLDLLQYDEQRYHLRDWDRDYVKELIAQKRFK